MISLCPNPLSGRACRLFLTGALWIGCASAALAATDDVNVTVDEAEVIKLARPAAEIIVGNPSIADVAVQSGKILVVTGKSFGRTNLIVIDGDGKEIINKMLSVQESRSGFVTLHKGPEARFTYYCAPNCTSTLAVGDFADHFKDLADEIKTKQGLGQAQAEGSAPQ